MVAGASSGPGPTRSAAVLQGFVAPVPDAVARRAAAYPAGGPPVEPVPSASVVLLRDAEGRDGSAGADGVEVYLLHRHARMPFAPSMAVFPGGKLDPVDHGSPDPLLACACREAAEETGVVLDASTLGPWAHWITPEIEPLRFDTSFYVARLPEGQQPADVSGETERAGWLGARQALAARERHELSLMPPTWSILTELAAAPDVAAVLRDARQRVVEAVLPRLVPTGSSWVYEYRVVG